nr:hypothetical protein VITISV_024378 [Ipomoea batatas]
MAGKQENPPSIENKKTQVFFLSFFSRFSYLPRPEQVDTEFLTRAFIRVDQMERLGIRAADYALIIGAHHEAGLLRGLSPNREPEFSAVTEQGPERDGVERASAQLRLRAAAAVVIVLELQRDADQAAAHFLRQRGGGDGELEEEIRLGVEPVVLDAEPHVAAAPVPEDGPHHHRLGRPRLSRRRQSRVRMVLEPHVFGTRAISSQVHSLSLEWACRVESN